MSPALDIEYTIESDGHYNLDNAMTIPKNVGVFKLHKHDLEKKKQRGAIELRQLYTLHMTHLF